MSLLQTTLIPDLSYRNQQIDSLRTRYGNDVEIKAPGEAGNTTDMWLIIWKNQTVNHASKDADGTTIAGWSTTFTVKAKDSYIGDNNVTTNGSGSGVSYDGNTTPFPQPTVNVKSQLKVDDNSVTIYKGDKYLQIKIFLISFLINRYNFLHRRYCK